MILIVVLRSNRTRNDLKLTFGAKSLYWYKKKETTDIRRLFLYLGRESNPHSLNGNRILSPACLPVPPPRQVSEKRDSNSRPQPWQGCALPTELFSHWNYYSFNLSEPCVLPFRWCQLDSNQRHKDFQSFALPTELWHLLNLAVCLIDDANIDGLFELRKLKALFFAFKRQPADF